jgi:hypothetical protein
MAISEDVMPADARARFQELNDQLRRELERFVALPRKAADRTPEQETEYREIKNRVKIARMELKYDLVGNYLE